MTLALQPRTRRGYWLILLVLLVVAPVTGADLLQGPIRGGFSVAEADRATGRRQWLLRGESATPLTGDNWEINGARLEVFGSEGATNLIITPSRCYFRQDTQQVTSSEGISVVTGDGHLSIRGIGFGLELKTGRLVVSNQVQAVIRKDLLERETGAATPVIPVKVSRRAAGEDEVITIQSRRLEYEAEQAVFIDQVRLQDSRGWITCRRLVAALEVKTRQIKALQAQEDVRLESEQVQGTAQQAAYSPVDERLELTGNPQWRLSGRSGSAERVVVERAERRLQAFGRVQMELPGETLAPARSLAPELARASAVPLTNVVQVTANEFELRPEPTATNLNWAIFRGNVVVAEGEARLRAGTLTLTLAEPANELRRAKAEDMVVIERGDQRMTCREAVYDAPSARLTLSGGTTWRLPQREGSSDAFVADFAERRYLAQGQVRMRFAEGTWPQGGPLFSAGRTPPPQSPADGATRLVGPVEVTADEFEYRANATPGAEEWAIYRGGVAVTETNRMQLTCAALTAQLTAGTNHLRALTADGGVEIRVTEPAGYRLARGDRASYDGDRQVVKLTGETGVDFFIVTPEGVSRGRGREAAYLGGAETLELEGDPVITTPGGELSGARVSLDRARNTLSASGRWQIRIPVGDLTLPELPMPAKSTLAP